MTKEEIAKIIKERLETADVDKTQITIEDNKIIFDYEKKEKQEEQKETN